MAVMGVLLIVCCVYIVNNCVGIPPVLLCQKEETENKIRTDVCVIKILCIVNAM